MLGRRERAGAQKAALLTPDFIASAAADNASDPQARWLLNQPRSVRESYLHDVIEPKLR